MKMVLWSTPLSLPSIFPVVGIATCAYYVLILSRKLISGFRGYVLPRFTLQSNEDLVSKYGSWAVVTGATDGIGLAYAKELAKRNLNIVLISRSEEKLRRVSIEIESEFSILTKIIVADFTEGRPVYDKIKNELKDISVGILVNNVGIFPPQVPEFIEMSEDMIWNMVNVNIAPVLLMTKMLLPKMRECHKGAIINVSSLAELQPVPLAALYGASKVLIRNFTAALQYENHKDGVTIQLLSPGGVRTNLIAGFTNHPEYCPNKILYPSAKDYARQAIGTLGILNYTTGYHVHSIVASIQSNSSNLFMTILEFLPEWLPIKMFKPFLEAARKTIQPILQK